MKKYIALIASTLFMFFASVVSAEVTEGVVTKVLDGDTVIMQIEGRSERIRLSGIDAPEKDQVWGAESTRALAARVENKPVSLVWEQRDKYNRIIGTLYRGKVNINALQVAGGHAWHYKQYSNSKVLAGLELMARKRGYGLWSADGTPVPPWAFRRM